MGNRFAVRAMTTAEPPFRSAARVRHLDAADLDLTSDATPVDSGGRDFLPNDDPILTDVADLMSDYGGIILIGPPGTGKSWYASRIANTLVGGDETRVRFLQFHPSYQYEDFVEGYVPGAGGKGFVLTPKHLIQMCNKAETTDGLCFIVIDELSRGDPGRIFGEALTYLEASKRGLTFQLASGTELSIPPNLIFLATMNPFDRGVDEVDAALERRFAKIGMEPSRDKLREFVTEAGMESELVERLLSFFDSLQARATTDLGKIGHTYFFGMRDARSLERLWRTQLRFVLEKAYRLDPQTYRDVVSAWNAVFESPTSEEMARRR